MQHARDARVGDAESDVPELNVHKRPVRAEHTARARRACVRAARRDRLRGARLRGRERVDGRKCRLRVAPVVIVSVVVPVCMLVTGAQVDCLARSRFSALERCGGTAVGCVGAGRAKRRGEDESAGVVRLVRGESARRRRPDRARRMWRATRPRACTVASECD
jgi:hypothetical protein